MAEFFHSVHNLSIYKDPEKLLPLQDDDGTQYVTVLAAKNALREGKKLGRFVIITNGKRILEHILGRTDYSLFSKRPAVRRELIEIAQNRLLPGQAILVEGGAVACNGHKIRVFGGFGKHVNGRTWAIIETHMHKHPPRNILDALKAEQMISDQEAIYWKRIPTAGCLADHIPFPDT